MTFSNIPIINFQLKFILNIRRIFIGISKLFLLKMHLKILQTTVNIIVYNIMYNEDHAQIENLNAETLIGSVT